MGTEQILLIAIVWNVIGVMVTILLHQLRWWPSTVWFGWLCIVLAGPLTWFLGVLLYLSAHTKQ